MISPGEPRRTGNRKQSIERVYENGNLWGKRGRKLNQNLTYTVNGQALRLRPGSRICRTAMLRWPMIWGRQERKEWYQENPVRGGRHPCGGPASGRPAKCFPLMIRNEDRLEVQDRVKLVGAGL